MNSGVIQSEKRSMLKPLYKPNGRARRYSIAHHKNSKELPTATVRNTLSGCWEPESYGGRGRRPVIVGTKISRGNFEGGQNFLGRAKFL